MTLRRSRATRGVVALVLVATLPGCRAVSDSYVIDEPSTVEAILGSNVSLVKFTEEAVHRLRIDTVMVAQGDGGLSVPSAALIIDPNGGFWVYTNPEPLSYVRSELIDIHQVGLTTFYGSGPEVGTSVVTVGVPELYGAETGIGK